MKNIISLLILILLVTNVLGQQNKLYIGFDGSPGLIFLRGNGIVKSYPKPTIGFSGGLFCQYNFQEKYAIRTAISFERKGSRTSTTTIDNNGEIIAVLPTNQNFDYLNIPVLFQVNFGKRIKYFVNAGAFFAYLIKQSVVASNGTSLSGSNTSNTNLYKRSDAGVVAGLGISIPLKEKYALSFEIRNNLGLLNVNKLPANANKSVKTNSTNLLNCLSALDM